MVRKYRIDWLRNDEKELYKLVSESDDTELFGDVFICDLLLNNDLSTSLFFKAMLPYCIQMGTTLYFYTNMLGQNDRELDFETKQFDFKYIAIWAVIFSMMVWMMYLEVE